jgi:uncharacterized protein
MQKLNGSTVYSASDLVGFLGCEHLTTLDLINLETPLPRAEEDDQARLIQKKGFEHEAKYLKHLQETGIPVFDVKTSARKMEEALKATMKAMAEGAPVIFQGCLHSSNFVGYVDFLRRVDYPSSLGGYSYEVVDTKLARSPKAKFIMQLCLYSDLVSEVQSILPKNIHVVLGDRTEQSYRLAGYLRYYRTVKARFLNHVNGEHGQTYPEPCAHCDLCHWRDICKEQLMKDDHLCQVANITKIQVGKLNSAGIRTLEKLARLEPGSSVPGMHFETLERLRRQAALQLALRETGENRFEFIETDPEEFRGFRRLPEPDPGDIFFDMEGDPLEEGGLEYLFGVYFQDDGQPRFLPFWAHSRQEERKAFEAFMAFVMERLKRYPNMHIYHYASYEESALKRLMSLHGTCEAEVDHLLRTEKLVDLYKVVHEGVLVSESRYSIKNLETFYMEKREGEVTNAGASIVYYENWKETREPDLLQKICDYNEDDCRSTYLLREWLLKIRPADLPWFHGKVGVDPENQKSERVHEAEMRLAAYQSMLLGTLQAEPENWSEEDRSRELVYQLLDFHRRADKPVWWAMFARQEMTEEELVEDPESIGGMVAMPEHLPEAIKQSFVYTYRYPEQEFKFKVGDKCLLADTLEYAGSIEALDEKQRIIRLKRSKRSGPLPDRISVITGGPIDTVVVKEALFRFAESVVAGDLRYGAIEAILGRRTPAIRDLQAGLPIVEERGDLTAQVSDVVSRLQESYLFVQGPPGTGKTYTGSHVIVDLLESGARVAVSSNSHKAINNLLKAVEKGAAEKNVSFRGIKKSSGPDDFLNGDTIEDTTDKKVIISSGANLVGGTAWLFSEPDLDQSFDYLFVDEAGQVALANLVAMGTCARNIVLLGDQMQLQQPIQGVHPGLSGESTLDYLLQGRATIPADQGVFLGTTWRMHEDICRFISEAVYDGRLKPEPDNQKQRLILSPGAHPELRATGIRFIGVEHDGCSQRSDKEAALVCDLYKSLLGQRYVDRQGHEHPMGSENVLVVAPYNMQVNLLKEKLPAGARVGTVDKFQGQQAEAVIVSMATSSGDDLPRHMEFLYSKNRLNVALSRARCLALLVANPKLMAIRCHTVEQMALVNTLCWVAQSSGTPAS